MEAGENVKRVFKDADNERIKIVERASSEAAKKRKKKLEYVQIKGDQKTKIDEGDTYDAGLLKQNMWTLLLLRTLIYMTA